MAAQTRVVFSLLVLLLIPLSAAAEVELIGPLTQGGLVRGKVPTGSRALLNGIDLKVGANGAFVFGFGRDDTGSATLQVIGPNGRSESQTLQIIPREFQIDRVDGLPSATVTIPPEERARRDRERDMVAEARSTDSDTLLWLDDFAWPAVGRISGVFGSQRILNGEPRSPHYGLDVASPVGTPVVAPQGGHVVLAEADFLLEGGIVIIDHGFGIFSTLFHMHSVDVAIGDMVEKGEIVGAIGQKGRANGPHVDWRVNWYNVRLDPELLVTDVPMAGPRQ